MSRKVYGKAYKISESDAKEYSRTSRPRKKSVSGKKRAYRPNPIGVTAMASVNGRGAYLSARRVMANLSQEARTERARKVIKNGDNMAKRASFLTNPGLSRARRGRALSPGDLRVIRREAEQAHGKRAAAKLMVAHGPVTPEAHKKAEAAKKKSEKAAVRRGKRLAAFQAAKKRGVSVESAKRAALKLHPLQEGEIFKGSKGKKKSKKVNRKVEPKGVHATYERLFVLDPRTGKRRLSYLAKGKGGKRVKIPKEALIASGMKAERIEALRKRAADKIIKSGDAFVPNKRSTSMKNNGTSKAKRRGKRLAAFSAARRAGKSKKAAALLAVKAHPLTGTETFQGLSASGSKKQATRGGPKRKKARRKTAKKTTKRKTAKKTVKRKTAKTSKRKAAKKTTKRKTAKKTVKRKTAKKSPKRKAAKKTTKRKTSKKRKMRRNGAGEMTASHGSRVRRRRRVRKNDFMSQLKQVAITGLFVAGGFFAHKIATNLLVTYGIDKWTGAPEFVKTWKKPIAAAVVLAVGVPAVQKLAKKNSMEISAGMVASFLQTTLVAALSPKQPVYAGYLSGYSNSQAYQLRGTKQSIMPQYAPVGAFEQAAAGFEQAAAGTGEYFSANGTGEFFAYDLQGVGSYEGAGALAMQAAAGADQIDDGIRPDSNIDGILDLAEAAAGLRGGPGVGEFFTAVQASGGRVVEKRVGKESQWVPSGPLWAGEMSVDATKADTQLPAGILQGDGGNGILSSL